MDRTLNTIQTFSKIGKVISKVIFVFCVIGIVGCALGVLTLVLDAKGTISLGSVQIHGILGAFWGSEAGDIYASLATGLITCAAEAVICKLAERYFANELNAGTPFTLAGAMELRNLGIKTIAWTIGSYVLSEIVCTVIDHFAHAGDAIAEIDPAGSVTLGIAFIVLSVFLKYGAEREANYAENQ